MFKNFFLVSSSVVNVKVLALELNQRQCSLLLLLTL